jgi:predicted short-subunit dehydrogenase-like oxidoreductase (DUF2520 family)
MKPITIQDLDLVAYHAAAGLVANGAAALAALGTDLLKAAGVPSALAPKMLGPLLRSVGDNVQALGFPRALTGPVRRGEARAVGRHLSLLRARAPRAVPMYEASVAAQLPLARQLGEARRADFDAIARLLGTGLASPRGRG